MAVHPDSQRFQTLLEGLGHRLSLITSQYDAAHIQAKVAEHIDEPQHIHIIGDAQIAAELVLFDVTGIDDDYYFYLFLHLQQHPQLAVRLKARQYPGCMIIIVQLSAEFQIQFASKFGNALPDMLRLHAKIFVIVKTDRLHPLSSFPTNYRGFQYFCPIRKSYSFIIQDVPFLCKKPSVQKTGRKSSQKLYDLKNPRRFQYK